MRGRHGQARQAEIATAILRVAGREGIAALTMDGEEIELEVDDKHTCSVRAAASFYRINGLSADEFPPLPKFPEEKRVSLSQETVLAMLKRTCFAISTDESRYVLNGIFFSLKEHKLTMVATDGRRLALAEEEVELEQRSEGEFIVPSKAVNELTRLLQGKGEVEIKYGENQAAFTLKSEKGGPILVITKLIEGNYPNYRQVITSAGMGAAAAMQAIRYVEAQEMKL